MSSLTNFNVPAALKSRFDAVCHAAGRTRTSVLIEMMEGYVISQGSALAAKAQQLREVDRIIRENRDMNRSVGQLVGEAGFDRIGCQTSGKSIFEPPSGFMDDGMDQWS